MGQSCHLFLFGKRSGHCPHPLRFNMKMVSALLVVALMVLCAAGFPAMTPGDPTSNDSAVEGEAVMLPSDPNALYRISAIAEPSLPVACYELDSNNKLHTINCWKYWHRD